MCAVALPPCYSSQGYDLFVFAGVRVAPERFASTFQSSAKVKGELLSMKLGGRKAHLQSNKDINVFVLCIHGISFFFDKLIL